MVSWEARPEAITCLTNWVYNDTYIAVPEADFVMYGLDNGSGVMVNPQFDSVSHYMIINADCENPEAVMKVLSLTYILQDNAEFRESIREEYPEVYEFACSTGFANAYNPFKIYFPDANDMYTPYLNYVAWKNGEMTDEEFEAYDAALYSVSSHIYRPLFSGLSIVLYIGLI